MYHSSVSLQCQNATDVWSVSYVCVKMNGLGGSEPEEGEGAPAGRKVEVRAAVTIFSH